MNEVYMFMALRRTKDNPGLPQICHREVSDINEESINKAIFKLKHRASLDSGIWRIYRSVNKRDLVKTKKKLMVEMIMNDDLLSIGNKWKTVMMDPACKSGRGLFLVDVDRGHLVSTISNTPPDGVPTFVEYDPADGVLDYLKSINAVIVEDVETINGHHYVCEPFDPREITKNFGKSVEIKKDAQLFIESFTI